ncbi:MAG: hypothetical protein C0501_11780 [Isosphaera sp.]|nr:hypothetical protein [Isosphaera sp.]
MRKLYLVGIGAAVLAVAAGCNNPPGGSPKGGDKVPVKGDGKEPEHGHGTGPHGGTVFDFGKWHGEFRVDHGKKQATVYVLGSDEKTAAPIKADKLVLSVKEPAFQVELKPDPQAGDPAGTASRFVGSHDNFVKEQEFAGTLSGVVEGKPYAGDFKEEPEGKKK